MRTVRDRFSADFLREAGVSSLLECSDLVYVSPPRLSIRDNESGSKPVLGVVASQPGSHFAHARYEGFESRICSALESLEKHFQLRFFSFDKRSDTWLASSWERPHLYSNYDPDEPDAIGRFTEELAGVDLFLTSRFHGAVMSIVNSVPFVAVGAPGEKTARECESIEYPYFVPYDAPAGELRESVLSAWAERHHLDETLQSALHAKQRLAHRNFELLRAAQVEGDILAHGVLPDLCKSANDGGRTLIVWAGKEMFWPEVTSLFDRLGAFDCLLPAGSSLIHPHIESALRLRVPVMHWDAFDEGLKERLLGQYGNVIVCHGTEGPQKPAALFRIAAAAANRVWEFRLWRHTLRQVEAREIGPQVGSDEEFLEESVVPTSLTR